MQRERPPQFNRIIIPFLMSGSSDQNETPEQRKDLERDKFIADLDRHDVHSIARDAKKLLIK